MILLNRIYDTIYLFTSLIIESDRKHQKQRVEKGAYRPELYPRTNERL